MKLLTMLFIATAVCAVCTEPATAQTQRNCGQRNNVVERLAQGYGETRKSVGIGSNNAMVETFASDKTGSWTIIVTMPSGITCLVASGQSYKRVNETLPTRNDEL